MKRQLSIHLLMLATLFASSSDIFAKRSKKRECRSRFEEYDYVIVGCGTGGSILAAKLSDPDSRGRFKNSVCVLEAGVNYTEDPLVLGANLYIANSFVYNTKYSYLTPATSFDSMLFLQSEGIMWGGSSGHNGEQGYRATPDIYNQWAAISGNDRWSYENLLNNVMIPMEHYTPNGTVANPAQRGFEGPLFITQEPFRVVNNDAFSQALATATGAGIVTDLNDIDALTNGQVGVSANQGTITPPFGAPNSIRSFGGNSFLTGIASEGIPAIVDADGNGLGGRKLKIISNAHANRIVFSKKRRAKGVEYTLGESHEETLVVRARKGVISCCGALYTPALFQRSGIGDAELLESLDIPVVVDNPHVGAHLANHVGGFAVIGDAVTDITFPVIGNSFIGLPPATGERTLQLLYLAGNPGLFFIPNCIRQFVDLPFESTVMLALDNRPRSEGTVTIVSADPFFQPNVAFNNYSDGGPSEPGSDANKIVTFYTTTVPAIAAEAGGTVLYPTPGQYAAGDDALLQAALISNINAFHQSGTCRMGSSIEDGVIDGGLKVFGVEGLYVADNAAAPVISDANTGLQAYIIGAVAARILRGEG